jgi:hypothetical protein
MTAVLASPMRRPGVLLGCHSSDYWAAVSAAARAAAPDQGAATMMCG